MSIQRLVSANYLRERMWLCNHFHATDDYSHSPFLNRQQTDERVHDRIARTRLACDLSTCETLCSSTSVVCLGKQILGRLREEASI